MNTVYNFYQEGVLQRYILKLGEFDEHIQQKPERLYYSMIALLLGCGLFASMKIFRRKNV